MHANVPAERLRGVHTVSSVMTVSVVSSDRKGKS
jgi:hypothetical protein